MPSTLAAPLYEIRALVGPGWAADGAPVTALADACAALRDIAAAAEQSWNRTADGWSGAAAGAAANFTATTSSTAAALADRAEMLSSGAREAGAAVAAAGARLQAIVDRFEERAAALEPRLDEPGVAEELMAEARQALREAHAVVDELRVELDRHAAAIATTPMTPAASPTPGAAAPTIPAGFSAGSAGPMSSGGWDAGSAGPMSSGSGWNAGSADLAAFTPPEAAVGLRDPGMFGDGVGVRLPDGSTAQAPNAVAAGAVRHALTQLGVPYRWGGTTPGVGLDCSGLTQWAYHEAGLDIPRLAQEQDIGMAVSADSLRPGDLAVWDGHVAMIVGNGTMIEAGDPVKLSPIRTSNAGQGFQGFWRPTA